MVDLGPNSRASRRAGSARESWKCEIAAVAVQWSNHGGGSSCRPACETRHRFCAARPTGIAQGIGTAAAKHDDTISFQKTTVEMDERRRKLETSALEKQRGFILEQVAKIGNLSEQLGSKSKGYIEEQRRNINRTRSLTTQLNGSLNQRLETLRQLKLEGLSSQDLVLNAQSSVTDGQIRMANLDVQEHEMQLQDVQRRQTQLEHENRRSDLAMQLMQLDISAQRLLQELTQNQKQRKTTFANWIIQFRP